ncbi:hypothetical protein Tco_0718136 [Tanacetum coccineum]
MLISKKKALNIRLPHIDSWKDSSPQRHEIPVENVSSVPRSSMTEGHQIMTTLTPVPPRQQCFSYSKEDRSSQQGLQFLFSPLHEEDYNPHVTAHADDNNNDQAPNASLQEKDEDQTVIHAKQSTSCIKRLCSGRGIDLERIILQPFARLEVILFSFLRQHTKLFPIYQMDVKTAFRLMLQEPGTWVNFQLPDSKRLPKVVNQMKASKIFENDVSGKEAKPFRGGIDEAIVEDTMEYEDGGEIVVREMVPCEFDSVLLRYLRQAIQESLKRAKDVVHTAKNIEVSKRLDPHLQYEMNYRTRFNRKASENVCFCAF